MSDADNVGDIGFIAERTVKIIFASEEEIPKGWRNVGTKNLKRFAEFYRISRKDAMNSFNHDQMNELFDDLGIPR